MMRKTLTGLLSAALVLASCAERPSLVDPAGFDGEVDGRSRLVHNRQWQARDAVY